MEKSSSSIQGISSEQSGTGHKKILSLHSNKQQWGFIRNYLTWGHGCALKCTVHLVHTGLSQDCLYATLFVLVLIICKQLQASFNIITLCCNDQGVPVVNIQHHPGQNYVPFNVPFYAKWSIMNYWNPDLNAFCFYVINNLVQRKWKE